MFVKLIDGNEPIIVNVDQVTWLEGMSGGQHCMVHFINGAVRVPKPADDVQALLDWAAPSQKEKQHGRR